MAWGKLCYNVAPRKGILCAVIFCVMFLRNHSAVGICSESTLRTI